MKDANKYKFRNEWVSFKFDALQVIDFKIMNLSNILENIDLYIDGDYVSMSGICCGKCTECNRISIVCGYSKGDVYYISEEDAKLLKEKDLLKDVLVTIQMGANSKWWLQLIDLGYEILSMKELSIRNDHNIDKYLYESIIISYKELLEIYNNLKNNKELRIKLSRDNDNFIDWEIFGCWIRDYLPFLSSFAEV